MKRLINIVVLLIVSVQSLPAASLKEDLQRLDSTLAKSGDYERAKMLRMSSNNMALLDESLSANQHRALLYNIYNEAYSYSFNIAFETLNLLENSSRTFEHRQDVYIEKLLLLATAGMFDEARDILSHSIDTTSLTRSQKEKYYQAMVKLSHNYIDNAKNLDLSQESLYSRLSYYLSKCFDTLDAGSFEYKNILISTLCREGNYTEAERVANSVLAQIDRSDRNYAIVSYYMAIIQRECGHKEEAMHWFVESACCDIKNVVKDNAALYSLALDLIDTGEIERSFNYTRVALDDALFYDARMRPFQIAETLPKIQNAYKEQMEGQNKRAMTMMIIMTVLALLMIVAFAISFVQRRRVNKAHNKLKEAEDELRQAIAQLKEANAAKEEYLALFLSMCSGYLDKLKKHINLSDMEEELNAFYSSFDNAFLNLYPHFVDDFNMLLKEEDRITLKKGEILSTELRIFALIKLGITQSAQIASLLRYSVNTIYNYRAQMKKCYIGNPEQFEDRVKAL